MSSNIIKPLYTCESIINEDSYSEMVSHLPDYYWACVKNGSLISLLLLVYLGLTNDTFMTAFITTALYQIFMMISCKVQIRQNGRKSYQKLQKKTPIDTHYNTDFYDDYFMRYGSHSILKVEYKQITRFIETDTTFYLEYNGMCIFQKDKCSVELIEFVRSKLDGILEESHGYISKKSKLYQKESKKNLEIILNILFMLTLLCLVLGPSTMYYLARDAKGLYFIKYAWGFWLWLPIPVISSVLGFKYRNRGFKCTKNIIAGFIIVIFLLIYGAFCFFPLGETSYSEINKYKTILGIDLPAEGDLTLNTLDTLSDNEITDVTEITVNYELGDLAKVKDGVEANDNWIPVEKLKSTLRIFTSFEMLITDDSYMSVYNHSLSAYNVLPDDSGEYKISVMIFNAQDADMKIYTFNYNYVE